MIKAEFRKHGAFKTCDNKGFHITFPNGVVLSTQFGGGNYGSNYDAGIGDKRNLRGIAADTVEVAAFDKDGGKWRTQEAAAIMGKDDLSDTVMGYLGVEEWLSFFDAVRQLPKSPASLS